MSDKTLFIKSKTIEFWLERDILFYKYINKFQFYIFYTFYLWTDPPKDDPTNEIIGISLTLLMKNKWKKWIRFFTIVKNSYVLLTIENFKLFIKHVKIDISWYFTIHKCNMYSSNSFIIWFIIFSNLPLTNLNDKKIMLYIYFFLRLL